MKRSVLGVFVALMALSIVPATSDATTGAEVSPAQRYGLQQVPKDVAGGSQSGNALTSASKGPNPYVALLPDPSKSDVAYWRAAMRKAGRARADEKAKRDAWNRAAGFTPNPLLVDEDEPDEFIGANDTRQTAQPIAPFGTAAGEFRTARVLGVFGAGPTAGLFPRIAEDNGSIPLARTIPIQPHTRRATAGTIGDGPHGSARDGTGDYDFYKLAGAQAGQHFVVDLNTVAPSPLDTVVIVFDATGGVVGLNDDDGVTLDSFLDVAVPSNGDYYAAIGGFPTFPNNPFVSGSGSGAGSEGNYSVVFGVDANDVDFYSVQLEAGDVLGATVTGGARDLAVVDAGGIERVGAAAVDASGIYPASSPLPGGGNTTLAHVATATGRHYLAVRTGVGNYDVTLELYRPAVESLAPSGVPTVFLDFDGARVNTSIFGGFGSVRQLSPMRAFLGRWGLTTAQENALIDRVIATVRENLVVDFHYGSYIRVLNSRDDPDPFGQPNVSRVIVGGTIAESGIPTIGIAQSIDPGNFELEETALVLLDLLSAPPSGGASDPSLNAYLRPNSSRVRFIGTALGNVVSHEAGHLVGSFHVDQFNSVLNIMDQGGNPRLLFGVGADGVGGTADDRDVDFGPDRYNPNEGFRGVENTAANTQWGLSSLRL